MNREHAIATLRAHEQELREIGVVKASVFGSIARNEAGIDSDVDLAVRLAADFSTGGFDYFSRLEELECRLSAILGCKVDLIEEPVRKKWLQIEIDRDRAVVF
jgi:predicted nucleotidyltransferase